LVDANTLPGETVLLAHPLDAASRLHRERHGTPMAAVTYSPISFWSDHVAPDFGAPTVGRHMPWWSNRAHLWLGNRLVIGPALMPALNALRRDLGLRPSPHIFPDYWYQADQNLCLFPDWFAPPQPDWPGSLVLAGFPLWDGSYS